MEPEGDWLGKIPPSSPSKGFVKPSKAYIVYELQYPDGRPFYVGKGRPSRPYGHLRAARRGAKLDTAHVIREIWNTGEAPIIDVVFETNKEEDAFDEERRRIAVYGLATLTNKTRGGEGWAAVWSDEMRAKISKAQKGVKDGPLSFDQRATQSHVLIGRSFSSDHRKNLALAGRKTTIQTRPSIDETLMQIAHVWSRRSTCMRRTVGCVIANDLGIIRASGYNGAPWGMPHCSEIGCLLDVNGSCVRAGHAEQNAIATAAREGVVLQGSTMISTVRPCWRCTYAIIGAGIIKILYDEEYSSDDDATMRDICERSGIVVERLHKRSRWERM